MTSLRQPRVPPSPGRVRFDSAPPPSSSRSKPQQQKSRRRRFSLPSGLRPPPSPKLKRSIGVGGRVKTRQTNSYYGSSEDDDDAAGDEREFNDSGFGGGGGWYQDDDGDVREKGIGFDYEQGEEEEEEEEEENYFPLPGEERSSELDPLVENWSKEFNKVTKLSNKEKLYKEFQHLNFENYQALEIAENVVDQFTGSDIILAQLDRFEKINNKTEKALIDKRREILSSSSGGETTNDTNEENNFGGQEEERQKTIEKLVSKLISLSTQLERSLEITKQELSIIDQEIQQELIKQEELFQTECRQISEKFLRWARGGGSGSGQSKKDSSKSKNRNKDENKNRKKQNRSSRAGGGGEGGNKGKGKNTTTTTTSTTKKKPTTNSKSGGGGGSWKGKGIMSNSTGSISDEDIQDGDSQEKVDAVEEQGRRKKRKTG